MFGGSVQLIPANAMLNVLVQGVGDHAELHPSFEHQRDELVELWKEWRVNAATQGGTATDLLLGAFPTLRVFLRPEMPTEQTKIRDMLHAVGCAGRTAYIGHSAPEDVQSLNPVEYIVYNNLSLSSVIDALKDRVDGNPEMIKRHLDRASLPHSGTDAWSEPDKTSFLFFVMVLDAIPIPVTAGMILGRPPSQAGQALGIEVRTEHGAIDPAYFVQLLQLNRDASGFGLSPEDEARWNSLRNSTLSATGKIFKPTVATDRYAQLANPIPITDSTYDQFILPYSVLKRANSFFLGAFYEYDDNTKAQWLALGQRQAALYMQRLQDLASLRQFQLRNGGQHLTEDDLIRGEQTALTANPSWIPFRFVDADWRNTFQLQAVAEFYLNYTTPRDLAASPQTDTTASGYVQLHPHLSQTLANNALCGAPTGGRSDLWLIQIDDFRLIGGSIPSYKAWGRRTVGEGASAKRIWWSMPDSYRGMMFGMKGGELKFRYLFSSYTSRAHPGTSLAAVRKRSSIRGNWVYGFRSVASGGKESINYSFKVTVSPQSPSNLGDPFDGRTYFDPGTAGVRAQEKAQIMIHRGLESHSGTGSEGCQVSPRYYDFRRDLINVVLADTADYNRLKSCVSTQEGGSNNPIEDLKAIRFADHTRSVEYYRLSVGEIEKKVVSVEEVDAALDAYDQLIQEGNPPTGLENQEDCMEWIFLEVIRQRKSQLESTHCDSQAIERAEWDALIVGSYVLIRPDEKHIGWLPD
jgi:hypothetical protein